MRESSGGVDQGSEDVKREFRRMRGQPCLLVWSSGGRVKNSVNKLSGTTWSIDTRGHVSIGDLSHRERYFYPARPLPALQFDKEYN